MNTVIYAITDDDRLKIEGIYKVMHSFYNSHCAYRWKQEAIVTYKKRWICGYKKSYIFPEFYGYFFYYWSGDDRSLHPSSTFHLLGELIDLINLGDEILLNPNMARLVTDILSGSKCLRLTGLNQT